MFITFDGAWAICYNCTLTREKVHMARVVICPTCKREIEVRSDFAHFTLQRHIDKEHK